MTDGVSSLQNQENLIRTIADNVTVGLFLMDQKSRCVFMNVAAESMTGYSMDELKGQTLHDVIHFKRPDGSLFPSSECPLDKSLIDMVRVKDYETSYIRKNGSFFPVSVSSSPVMDRGLSMGMVLEIRDLTERRASEARAQWQRYHDQLTGLPNRSHFTERLVELCTISQGKKFSVLIIDLDRFKLINESLGHQAGDRLIQEVADRLVPCLGDTDILARMGGDEYGIILSVMDGGDEIDRVCTRIRDCLKDVFRFDGTEMYINASIGVAVYPNDGADASALFKNAESALYRAKEAGRNNFQHYESSMNATTFQKLAMENTLRRAVENKEFLVYYQPQIDVRDGRIIQVEALVRWMHPQLGLTMPSEFVGIAEVNGLIHPIGEWVLRQACLDVGSWDSAGHRVRLAVNLSARQLKQKHIVRSIRKGLSDTGFDPSRLELEITESVLIDDSDSVYNTLVQLKKNGIRFAIDDFNTRYSSLNYLKHFPVDALKLDKSFMSGIPGKEKDSAIVNAIINLSRSLGLSVVAEGIERPEQLKFLKERNCDMAQGYMFSPPVPADQLLKLLNLNSAWN